MFLRRALALNLVMLVPASHVTGQSVHDDSLALLLAPGPEPFMSYAMIGRITSLKPTDIAAIEISDSGDITDVFVRMEPEATADFAEWTEIATGFPLSVSICDMRVLEATVQAPVTTGTIYIPNLNAVQAEALRALWHGRQTCSDIPAEVFPDGP